MRSKLGYAGIGLSAVLPIVTIIFFITDSKLFEAFSIYNFFWCALYGCVIMWIFSSSLVARIVLTLVNAACIILFATGALMGGFAGELIVLQCLVIPLYEFVFL